MGLLVSGGIELAGFCLNTSINKNILKAGANTIRVSVGFRFQWVGLEEAVKEIWFATFGG